MEKFTYLDVLMELKMESRLCRAGWPDGVYIAADGNGGRVLKHTADGGSEAWTPSPEDAAARDWTFFPIITAGYPMGWNAGPRGNELV